jgi:hypothetical protein
MGCNNNEFKWILFNLFYRDYLKAFITFCGDLNRYLNNYDERFNCCYNISHGHNINSGYDINYHDKFQCFPSTAFRLLFNQIILFVDTNNTLVGML